MKRRALLLGVASMLGSFGANGQTGGIIAAGREHEVLALFAPFALGKSLTADARLMNVRVEPRGIVVELEHPGGRSDLRFRHKADAKGPEVTRSFVVERDPRLRNGPGAEAASLLVAQVRKNDRGGFFRHVPRSGRRAEAPLPSRHRGLAVPIVVTAMGLAAAWGLRRRPQSA